MSSSRMWRKTRKSKLLAKHKVKSIGSTENKHQKQTNQGNLVLLDL